jgi:flagellar biosynthetic protein FlhB
MADEIADKTEAPTLQRRAEARRDGKLAVSAELSAAVLCLAAAILLQQTLPRVAGALRALLIEGLSAQSTSAGHIGFLVLRGLAPLAIGLLLIAIAVNVIQTRFWIGWKKETGALNIADGVHRIFNRRSAFALVLNLIKLTVVALIAWSAVRSRIGDIVTLQMHPADDLLLSGISIVLAIAIRVSIALIVLGVIDYLYQLRRLESELRMTRRQVRDELRRQEGDPEQKRRRRGLWRDRKARAA